MRNEEFSKRGSSWRKWDLHVHTPLSIEQGYGGENGWDKYFDELRALPAEIEVVGINDYLFLDGYWRVKAEWEVGRLPKIKLLLPVIELRIDKFGGSGNQLSRANFHVIFSNDIDTEIEPQFLHSLSTTGYQIGDYIWDRRPTREAVEDLGREIKARTPEGVAPPNGSDLKVGHDNVNITIQSVRAALKNSIFKGKALSGVGLAEWNDIRWDGSTAEKKSLIDRCNFVFTASPSVERYNRSKQSLIDNAVNPRLIHASDAHYFTDSDQDNRLAKTYTWIKSDPTFEGLKQSLYEFESRVKISENPPIYPVNQIEKVSLNFPQGTKLISDGAEDTFCFSGNHEFNFSPYFTAIIGGRGTGKSTLLNLIDEHIHPGKNKYFDGKNILPDDVKISEAVEIDGVSDPSIIEFLEQNEIERFAVDYKAFTNAIYQRIYKGENRLGLSMLEKKVTQLEKFYDDYYEAVIDYYEKVEQKRKLIAQLESQKSIIKSFTDEQYIKLNDDLKKLTTEKQSLQNSLKKLDQIVGHLNDTFLFAFDIDSEDDELNEFDRVTSELLSGVSSLLSEVENNENVAKERENLKNLNSEINTKREKIESFLAERGHSPENMKDISGANEKIALLESDLKNINLMIQKLSQAISDPPFDRSSISEFEDLITAALEPINENLDVQNEQVSTINIEFEFDYGHLHKVILEYLHSEINKIESYRATENYLRSIFSELDFREVTTEEDLLTVIDAEATTTAGYIRDYLNDPVKFHSLRMKLEDELLQLKKYGRFKVQYDNRPLENNSFGQRCTATLVILLLLGNTPIIIDEPEAHLDSRLVAEYLVDLIKTKKTERQIIFATHNANFVVNGDADLIHCLTIDEDLKITSSESITIEVDDKESRERLLALEGGQEAFQRRENRYGLRI